MAETRQEEKEEQEGKDWIIGLLRRLIETMSEKCRRILDLRDLQGESYVAICKALKVPMGTVMSQLARCRDTLRKMIQSSLGENL
jgi:RNA polymerase sigma factor (sigma-70 family)